ncbi:MAG: dienelactone hydrolase family protein [Stellaceae bacterium]
MVEQADPARDRGVWAEAIATDAARFRAYVVAPLKGIGPGLIVLHGRDGLDPSILALCHRFADEGYAVLAPDLTRHWRGDRLEPNDLAQALGDVLAARTVLAPLLEASARTGAVGVGDGNIIAWRLAANRAIDALVAYAPPRAETFADADAIACAAALHIAGTSSWHSTAVDAASRSRLGTAPPLRLHEYPDCKARFFDPLHPDFDRHAAAVAHSRTLAVLRPALGPHYDLAQLFDYHLRQEFVEHDADETMATMVEAPYVNHVPTLTGGVGHDMLKRFYKYHFIPKLPESRRSILLSETVGPDTVVRETITAFRHTEEIDYLLPGIEPTGKEIEVATVVIAKFRGGKLYHEHIYWDQASVLVQLGLIDPDGLPVAGAAAARKMLDQTLPANELMARWKESEGKPL